MATYNLMEDVEVGPHISVLAQDDRTSLTHTSLLDKKSDFNILEKLKHLRDNKKFCDVVLEVRGVKFVAHKNVLASWSPTFASKLFGDNLSVFNDYIMVYYDNSEVFSDLLDFMYNGYVAPRETNFLQLLHLAVSFQIETLKNYCEEFLRCNLHLGNFVSTYFLSRKFKLENLEEYIVGFLQLNLSDTVKQGEFLSLKAEKFNTFLSEGWMRKINPEIKLFLIISWVGYDVTEREKYLVLLLGHINWSTVANDFLLEINRTENFFTTHESSLYLLLQTLYSAGIALGPYKEVFPSLRQSYSSILKEVVHTSLLVNDTETFHPVTISVRDRPVYRDASMNTVASALPGSFRDMAVNTDVNSLHFQEPEAAMLSTTTSDLVVEHNPVPEQAKYDQFETLGEFIEAEIHEIKLRENKERLLKEKQDVQVHPMDEKIQQGAPMIVSARRKTPKKKQKMPDLVENYIDDIITPIIASPDDKQTSSVLRKSERTKTSKRIVLIDDFEEFHDQDNETPLNKIARGGEEEDMKDTDTDDALNSMRESVVNSIKVGSTKKQKARQPSSPEQETDSLKSLMCTFEDCAYITKWPQRLEKHVKIAHETSFELKCNLCAFETKEVRKYNTHMKGHFSGPPFHCDYPRCTHSAEKVSFGILVVKLLPTMLASCS